MPSSAAIVRQLEAVHLAFHVGVIDRLYPSLGPEERPEAVARERMRDSSYLINMRQRIREGVAALRLDRSLTQAERDTKIALLTATELRYLRQHIEAASWRLQSESDMSRLRAKGEDGAFWELTKGVEHCVTCERMGDRWWPWRVLEVINPATTHPQCHCVLRTRQEAERAGHKVVTGRHTPSVASLYELGAEAREMALAYIQQGEELREARRTELAAPDPAPAPVSRGTPPGPFRPLPPPAIARNAKRDERICEMWSQEGKSQSAIGREVGLSQPRVRAILLDRFGAEALRKRGKAGARHDLAAA